MEMEIEMVMCIKRDRDKERKGERVGSDAQVKAHANLKCLAVERLHHGGGCSPSFIFLHPCVLLVGEGPLFLQPPMEPGPVRWPEQI